MQYRQLEEGETFLLGHEVTPSPGSQPHTVALLEMSPSSWIFMAQTLYDFTDKGKTHRQ